MKKVLLIVDDEEIVRKALSSQFDQEEIEVLTANDGQEGLKIALERHPNLILLDLVMPIMDGMTMLNKLRQNEWGKKAEIIILTNLSNAEKVAGAVELGTYEYLVKVNWNVSDVVNKIKDKLDL